MKQMGVSLALAVLAGSAVFFTARAGDLPAASVPNGSGSAVASSALSNSPLAMDMASRGLLHRKQASTEPVNLAPEPGTIALASLGLMALGAATRRRRGN